MAQAEIIAQSSGEPDEPYTGQKIRANIEALGSRDGRMSCAYVYIIVLLMMEGGIEGPWLVCDIQTRQHAHRGRLADWYYAVESMRRRLSDHETRTVSPTRFRLIEHAEIALSDGVTLSAMIWLPVDAEDKSRSGHSRISSLSQARWHHRARCADPSLFRGHGYACVRVDMRGSGDSEGVLLGEYLKQEQDDALEILTWMARAALVTGRSA